MSRVCDDRVVFCPFILTASCWSVLSAGVVWLFSFQVQACSVAYTLTHTTTHRCCSPQEPLVLKVTVWPKMTCTVSPPNVFCQPRHGGLRVIYLISKEILQPLHLANGVCTVNHVHLPNVRLVIWLFSNNNTSHCVSLLRFCLNCSFNANRLLIFIFKLSCYTCSAC